jgi:ribosome-binding factor A
MTARTDRIDELFRQEIGSILSRDVEDRRIGFATIIAVETAPDLRHAKVRISVIGSPDERRTTIAAIGRAMPFVRHELGKRLRLQRIPEFHLELDETLERGTRVLRLLDEIEAGNNPDELPPVGESLPTPVKRLPHLGDAEPLPGEEPQGSLPPGPRRRPFRTPKHRPVPGRRPR